MTLAQRRRRTLYAAGGFLVVALFALVAFLIIVLFQASGQIHTLSDSSAKQQAQVDGLAGGVESLRAQVTSLGATPVVPAPSQILKTIEVSGPAGAQGPGPSDSQVEAAVAAYLAAHPVPGVSNQQVASAVDAYFAKSPPPSGPQGPGPSQQQIADAVASYMAANPAPSGPAGPAGSPGIGETGPSGPTGPAGQDGAPGSPPAGWSYTDPSGNAYTCVPDDATPAPNYTCSPVAPSTSTSAAPTDTPSDTTSAASNANAADVHDAAASTTPAAAHSTPAEPAPSPSPTPPLSRILGMLAIPLLRRDDY